MELLKRKIAHSDTEAWANVDHYKDESHVSVPSEESVENQMDWLHVNEK
ncbi:DUF3787 domain-containing protein [Fusibacter sp. A1]|nr:MULTISPECIES: DUF3787 domain-containing protein [unclassified Fusibacter]NPE22152.1 DUF3787 domain-containing protein [Fusibacter sp. A1]